MFIKYSINPGFLGCFVMCFFVGTLVCPWNVASQMLDEEKTMFSNENEEEEPIVWLNSEVPTYGNVYDEPWTDDRDSFPYEDESLNEENEQIIDDSSVTKENNVQNGKSGKEKTLKRSGQDAILPTSQSFKGREHGYVTVNDIASLTRNTKITIIASLCSIAVVFMILLGAMCYFKFNNIFPRSAVEKMKGAMSSFRSGNKSGMGDSHVDNADAERAEDESEDDENEDADFTVYECEGPALATSDMELRNPMFHSTKVEADQQ